MKRKTRVGNPDSTKIVSPCLKKYLFRNFFSPGLLSLKCNGVMFATRHSQNLSSRKLR